jgi:hypothetical protein
LAKKRLALWRLAGDAVISGLLGVLGLPSGARFGCIWVDRAGWWWWFGLVGGGDDEWADVEARFRDRADGALKGGAVEDIAEGLGAARAGDSSGPIGEAFEASQEFGGTWGSDFEAAEVADHGAGGAHDAHFDLVYVDLFGAGPGAVRGDVGLASLVVGGDEEL